MIRPSSSAVPIRNGSRFSRKKPYIGHRTRKNADPSLRFGPHRASGDSLAASAASSDIPATSARRRSGISDNRLHTLSYRFSSSICFRFLRMKPLPTEETSLAAARPDTQPAGASHSQQIRKFRMRTCLVHGSYIIAIRQSGKRLSHRLLHVPFCPLYRKRTYRLVASLSGHLRNPCSKASPAPSKPQYSGGSDVSTAGATSSPLRKSRGRRHGRPTAS